MGDAEIINAKPHAVILNSFYKCWFNIIYVIVYSFKNLLSRVSYS
jgi:hypothetical protein